MDWLEECGLLKYYRRGKRNTTPKITAKGMNWIKMLEDLLEVINYDEFRAEFTSWNYQQLSES
jgi:hypothetical protein